MGIRIFSYLDQGFPTKLRKIADPPAVVYVLGNIECLIAQNEEEEGIDWYEIWPSLEYYEVLED